MKQRLGVMRTAALTAVIAAMQIPAHAGFSDDPVPAAKPAPVAVKTAVVPSVAQVSVTPVSVDSAPVAATAVAVPAPKILPVWTMTAGHTIGQDLKAWGVKADWHVIWNMQKDWAVPAPTSISGDFRSAASEVIKTLAANGALVRAQFYDGNRTMVVTGPGVAAQ
jgi:hypothetical protein